MIQFKAEQNWAKKPAVGREQLPKLRAPWGRSSQCQEACPCRQAPSSHRRRTPQFCKTSNESSVTIRIERSYFNFRVSSPPLSSFSEKRKSFQSGLREFWEGEKNFESEPKTLITTNLFDLWRAQHLKAASSRRSDEFNIFALLYNNHDGNFTLIWRHMDQKLLDPSLCLSSRAPRGQDPPLRCSLSILKCLVWYWKSGTSVVSRLASFSFSSLKN